jgi:signal transduction histidine kinase
VNPNTVNVARPSPWWYVAVAAFGLGAVAVLVVAAAYESVQSRPIGEGALFLEETAWAAQQATVSSSGDLAVRQIRNDLEVESVSVVSPDGTIIASTSATLVDTTLDHPVISFAHSIRTFAAAAMPMNVPVVLDGVSQWQAGDTLYAVVHPVGDGSSVLVHYDISELLARRTRNTGVSPGTFALVGAAFVSALLATVAVVGRSRAANRFRVLEREAELLRIHTAELEERNIQLDAARSAAEQALALAEEKNRIRAEFVLMINHELRTPLTSVLTGAHLLTEPGLDSVTRDAILTDMLRDGIRLEQMISQILSVARIENRGLTSTAIDIDAATAWLRITSNLAQDTAEELSPELVDLQVRTDPDTLAQLVASLVDNASQHGASSIVVSASAAPTIRPDISVGTVVETGLVISIADDGPGIDQAFMPRLFEKFEKNSFSSGTGLGLYVARLMAEAIDCSIDVASSSNGSTFEITVPLAHHVTRVAVG